MTDTQDTRTIDSTDIEVMAPLTNEDISGSLAVAQDSIVGSETVDVRVRLANNGLATAAVEYHVSFGDDEIGQTSDVVAPDEQYENVISHDAPVTESDTAVGVSLVVDSVSISEEAP